MPRRPSVVPSTKREVERETGLEPATLSLEGFSLEGLSVYAL
jgi:hypothetical protein